MDRLHCPSSGENSAPPSVGCQERGIPHHSRLSAHQENKGNLLRFDREIKGSLPTEWLSLHKQVNFSGAEWNTSGGAGRLGSAGSRRTMYIGEDGPPILPVVVMLLRGKRLVGQYVFDRASNSNELIKRHWIGKGIWIEEQAPVDAINFDEAWENRVAQCAWVEVYKSGPDGPIDELADMLRKVGYTGKVPGS